MNTFKNIVLNIPHSSFAEVFNKEYGWPYNANFLNLAIKLTDWHTDFLFDKDDPRIHSVVFPVSRFICDAERLVNDPMEAAGQGILYTVYHGFNRRTIADDNQQYLKGLYANHLQKLSQHILRGDKTLVIDCHSFHDDTCPDVDICIGYNEDWSKPAQEQIDFIVKTFESAGYKVGINHPYSNSITPDQAHHDYKSVMIEVNKKCYLRSGSTDINIGTHYAPKLSHCINKVYEALLSPAA